jgi:hypothetical protein
MPPEIVGTDGLLTAATGTAVGTIRINLAIPHLLCAAACSRKTRELERSHQGKPFGVFWEEILAQATAAVLISVAGLEAYANELFIDHEAVFPAIPVELMEKLWELSQQKSALEKYELALLLKERQAFDRGAKPYQHVAALTKLRNGLVHFKPEWFDQLDEHAKVSKLLAVNIEGSPFLKSEQLFPRAWAGSDCTVWAVRSVTELIIEFERRAGIQRLARFIDRIRP